MQYNFSSSLVSYGDYFNLKQTHSLHINAEPVGVKPVFQKNDVSASWILYEKLKGHIALYFLYCCAF